MIRWLLNRKHWRMASLLTEENNQDCHDDCHDPHDQHCPHLKPLMAKNRETTPSSSTGFVWQNLPFIIHYNHHHPHKSTSHCWTWIRVPWRTKTWLTSSKMSQPSTIILSIARFFRMFSVSETCNKMLERDEIFQLGIELQSVWSDFVLTSSCICLDRSSNCTLQNIIITQSIYDISYLLLEIFKMYKVLPDNTRMRYMIYHSWSSPSPLQFLEWLNVRRSHNIFNIGNIRHWCDCSQGQRPGAYFGRNYGRSTFCNNSRPVCGWVS